MRAVTIKITGLESSDVFDLLNHVLSRYRALQTSKLICIPDEGKYIIFASVVDDGDEG